MVFSTNQIYLRILFTIATIFLLNSSKDLAVFAKPQIKQNQDWILPASRDETENGNTFKLSQIVDQLSKWWPFSSEKTFIPAINPNELLKRVGIVPKGEGEEANWLIFENNENDNVEESNQKDDDSKFNYNLDISNRIEELSNTIPTKIKKSIDSMKSDFLNATERMKYHLDKARNSLIDNVKGVFNLPKTEPKLPKESTNDNSLDFLEEKILNPVTKFVDSIGIEDKINKFYTILYRRTL